MAPQFLISVENALCRVNRHANLRIESFTIHQGEHWCVFGPNGSGKSLLAALLSGRRVESGQYVTHQDDFDPARDCLFVSFEEQQRLWQRDNRLDMSEYSERAEDQGTLVEALIQSGKPTSESDEAALENIIAQLDLDGRIAFSDIGHDAANFRNWPGGRIESGEVENGLCQDVPTRFVDRHGLVAQ